LFLETALGRGRRWAFPPSRRNLRLDHRVRRSPQVTSRFRMR
jgi:hypothetical protein